MRGIRWTWTLNNYTREEIDHLRRLGEELVHIRYLCWGEEIGEEGTPHLQGYLELSSKKRFQGVKNMLGDRFHIELTRKSGETNVRYCKKTRDCDTTPNEVFIEFGQLVTQGQRTDLEEVKESIENGATEQEIAQQHFSQWVRYRASFQRYRTLLKRRVSKAKYPLETFPLAWQSIIFSPEKTIILIGESGIGKTEFALAIQPDSLFVSHLDDLKLFDPDIHKGIIFDDVDINHHPRTSQIHILDSTQDRTIHVRYECAFIPKLTPKIFTCNEMPCNISDPAIRRRVEVHKLIKV